MERVVGSVKERYIALQGPIPIKMVKSPTNERCKEVPTVERLVRVEFVLTNLDTRYMKR